MKKETEKMMDANHNKEPDQGLGIEDEDADPATPDAEPEAAAPQPATWGDGEGVREQQDQDAQRIAILEKELDEAKDKMIRAVAEAENTRRRTLREREDVRKYAIADFARSLLDFSDNFRRALDSIPEDLKDLDERINSVVTGIEAMEKELLDSFEKHGIKKITPMDEIFDPNFHEVMFEAPATGKPAGTIVQIIEPGYLIHDRLLRPARVGVAKEEGQGSGSPAGPGGNVDQEV